MPRINPAVLTWARETAGLDLAEAARKIGLSAARGVEAPARLAALERGDEMPSRALLARMSKQYRRPLVVFYLAEPPVTGDRGTDFRTATERDEDQEPLLDAIIRDVRSRQGLVRTALLDEDDVEPLQFVGQYSLDDGISALRDALREVLTFDRERFRASSTVFDAFDYLRSRAEDAGIFVLLIGDLGSHHTAISPQTFRGYTLADPIAPFVVLNDRDARSAWSFTLLHELCHLLLGTSGVSGAYAALEIERVCDDVASGLLLDDGELDELMPTAGGRAPSAAEIAAFARSRNISRTMVVYRLVRRGSIDRDQWVQLRDRFRAEWLEHRDDVRARNREAEGGPSYYVVRRHRIGAHLLGTVSYLLKTGSMTTVKAAKVLGVKPKNVAELLAGGPKPANA
jgi:Zn-dependent peptidase ImmA (M78 family)